MDERFIFILLFFILMFIFAEENQQEFIFLTKGTKTHHRINYLNTDQCMRRPGQEEIGSYGLVFKRKRGYLCDTILICYPSQLLANNTLDGIITPIPYRLNIICMIHHSLILNLARRKTYLLESKNVTFPDEDLVNEYLSKVGKGAFLYKYTGLWALGLDLLPTPAQHFLHLFVYIGCGCPTDVWVRKLFKTPTISSSLVPKRPADVLTVKDRDCKKRYTNHSKFSLGNITDDNNKLLNFTLWTDKNVEHETTVKLIAKGGTMFVVYIYPDRIILRSSAKEVREKSMSNIEAIVDITIVLNKYYSWIKVNRKAINDSFVKKIWPKNWWVGRKLLDVEMIINGDVILVSPINVRVMSEEEVTKMEGITRNAPYSAAVDRPKSRSFGLEVHCMVNKNATKFSIKLLHGVFEENDYIGHTVIALTVDLTKNNLAIYSTKDDKSNSTGKYFPHRSLQQNKTKIFEKGKPFELYINITDKSYTSIDVNIFVNKTRTIELPIWMIQYIHIDGDIQLFSIYRKEKDLLKPPRLKFVKQVDELKNIERILNLNFIFETGKYEFTEKNTTVKYKEGNDSRLLLRTYFNQSWEYTENQTNPIRSGVPINFFIYANEHYYKIVFVNGGDFLFYQHRYPAWTVNYIVVN
ncbi:Galectin domain-containing protein [Meloidogyne graminicola]|uniref:Galectin domain-containing protein n=1 Tax=Meloidogyne graminicola TaxID=189291 RepID=A0A8S9ZJD5_9BILA|nr:Galectin domain-containing protein [Meloidogyne graminicola]